MKKHKQPLDSIKKMMSRVIRLPHQLSAIGYNIYKLMSISDAELDNEIDTVKVDFSSLLLSSGFDDLLTNQIEYAIRIANSKGNIEYEEMHKLFSLCDEIRALQSLGLECNGEVLEDLEKSLRYRFKREKRKAHFCCSR